MWSASDRVDLTVKPSVFSSLSFWDVVPEVE